MSDDTFKTVLKMGFDNQELFFIKQRIAERRAVLVKAIKSCPSIYEGGEGEEYALMKQVCELDYILTGKWGKYHE